MAIVATDYHDKVNAYYQATFGRQATAAELAAGEENLLANKGSVWTGSFQQDLSEEKGWGTEALSADNAQAQVDEILSNLFGTQASTLDASIAQYYVRHLVAGTIKPRGVVNAMLNDLGIMPKVDGTLGKPAGWGDGPDAELTASQIDAYEAEIGHEDPVPTGDTYQLTSGTDRGADFEGTSGNDVYDAPLAQNPFAGGVSNSLSSADVLDGKGGEDVLHAEIVPEFFGVTGDHQIDVQPTISNIETIELEARDAGGNNDNDTTVTFDAKKITDVKKIGSVYSDGDLVIENLTTLTSGGVARNTGDITVVMDHTDNFNSDNDASDLHVYFDEDYLISGQSSTVSQANFWLLDEDSRDYALQPLLNIERNGFTLTVDGTPVEIKLDEAVAAAANTWDAYAAAIQDRIDAMVAAGDTFLAGITAKVDWNNTDQTYNDFGVLVTIPAISLVDSLGRTLVPTGFLTPSGATGGFDIYGRFDNVLPEPVDDPVSVNIDLHKVGREGEGGDLIVGGKELDSDGGRDAEGKGIDKFYVNVLGAEDKPSNIGLLSSTNNDLDSVVISTDAAYVDGTSYASLTIRDGFGTEGTQTLDLVDASAFLGDLRIGTDDDVDNLITLTATGGGDVDFYGNVNGNVKNVYSYTTGDGNDLVDVTLDGDAVDTNGTGFAVKTNAGDDSVWVDAAVDVPVGYDGVSQETMAHLSNLSISVGSGKDTVVVEDYQRYNIEAGAGSDYVYINSQNTAGASTGQWVYGPASAKDGNTFASQVLYKATLTLTFAGFESVAVDVETTAAGKYIANQMTINAAIMKAIDSTPELKQMLEATLGTGLQQLTVNSLVDGINNLEIHINQPDVVTTAPTAGQVEIAEGDVLDLVAGLMATGVAGIDSSSDAAAVAGALDTADVIVQDPNDGGSDYAIGTGNVNFSVINMGDGDNDLVVFDSNTNSSNILVVDQLFGKVSVVNFFDNAPGTAGGATVGNHLIDFTKYLSDMVDSSDNNNNLTAENVNITLDSDANGDNFVSNSVNMVVDLVDDATQNQTFDTLTAKDLLDALNGDKAFANIEESNPVAQAFLVGNTQNHMVMVENPQNAGEYKVFHLTSTLTDGQTTGAFGDADNDGADFAAATLLGTLDFGDSINFGLVGNDAWDAAYRSLLVQADGGTPVTEGPDLTSMTPADNATDVSVTTDLVMTFDEAVFDGTGSLTVNYAGGSVAPIEIDITDDMISGNLVTVDIPTPLGFSADYYITIDEGAVVDADGNAFAGITSSTAWNFSTVEAGEVVVVSGDIGTQSAPATLDASAADYHFTDNATIENNVTISNFAEGDQIQASNAVEGNYSFSNEDTDVSIIYNNNGVVNEIVLAGVVASGALVYDEASFEAAVGFDAFTLA